MTTCKYCGRPSMSWCCEFCWDDFEEEQMENTEYDEDMEEEEYDC